MDTVTPNRKVEKMTCTTCARPVDDRYVNEAAGEGCVDPSHDNFISDAERELAEERRVAIAAAAHELGIELELETRSERQNRLLAEAAEALGLELPQDAGPGSIADAVAERERKAREARAELAILEEYDHRRQARGHDYGAGQRAAELHRRRREVEALGELGAGTELHRTELAAAWRRVGRPRLERAEREMFRRHTPATRRTLKVWDGIGRLYRA